MPTKKIAPLQEIGSSGLNYSAGIIDEESLPQLKGENARKVYAAMRDNDPLIGGILFAIDMLIRGVEWTVEKHPEGTEEDAEFVQQCMDDMSHSWTDFISEVLTMLPFGWSWFEIVFKQRQGEQEEESKVSSSKFSDGKIGWRKFAIRAQDSLVRWDISDDGSLRGFVQQSPPDFKEVIIPITKSLHFRTSTAKNNPEGRSVLRSAFRPWYYKKQMEEIEGVGVERDLAGLPFAKIHADILISQEQDMKDFVQSIRTLIKNVRQNKEAGVIFPIIYDDEGRELATFELLNSGGARTFDITNIITRYDQRMAMTVLADFIMLGHGETGSWALSSDKTNLFATALGAWLNSIEDVLNRFAVHRLFRVNGMDTTKLPTIKHKDIEKPDLQMLVGYLSGLATIGMPLFPDETLEAHLRDLADLPEQSEEAKEAADQQQQQELMSLMQQQQQQEPAEEPPEPPEEEQE